MECRGCRLAGEQRETVRRGRQPAECIYRAVREDSRSAGGRARQNQCTLSNTAFFGEAADSAGPEADHEAYVRRASKSSGDRHFLSCWRLHQAGRD